MTVLKICIFIYLKGFLNEKIEFFRQALTVVLIFYSQFQYFPAISDTVSLCMVLIWTSEYYWPHNYNLFRNCKAGILFSITEKKINKIIKYLITPFAKN